MIWKAIARFLLILSFGILSQTSWAQQATNSEPSHSGPRLLDFRLEQISLIQTQGSAYSGILSWNPRYELGSVITFGANLGMTVLRLDNTQAEPVFEYTVAAGLTPKGALGIELIAGEQRWFHNGATSYNLIGADLVYTFRHPWLGSIDRIVAGYQGETINSIYTNVVRAGLSFRLDSPPSVPDEEEAHPATAATPAPAAPLVTVVGSDCRDQPFTSTLFARPLTAAERQHLGSLPYRYLPRGSHHVKTLQLGEMTGLTPGGLPYVRDAQVIMAFDLNTLPPLEQVVDVNTAIFRLGVKKVSRDGRFSREVFCLIDDQFCSGRLMSSPYWRKNINPQFFRSWNEPRNAFFSQQYLDHPVETLGAEKVYAAEISLPLDKIAENTLLSAKEILYGPRSAPGAPIRRTLFVAVAADTFVSNDARLDLSLSVNRCSVAKP